MVDPQARLRRQAKRRLRKAFEQHRLTLFVGAGVSIDSGLPSWRTLLGNLFINSPRQRQTDFILDTVDTAVGRWFFEHSNTPLEILGRRIRASYDRNRSGFLRDLRLFLYFGSYLSWLQAGRSEASVRRDVLRNNLTLQVVVTLCRRSAPGRRGLRRVVTYNYDNLLEFVLPRRSTQAIWQPMQLEPRALPIYHVHGFVPVNETASASSIDDIVLTEDQYNRVANDPYSWTNLVQLQAITDSVGLVVGMSLDDRNLRRLLDATNRVAQRPELYAFVRKPHPPELTDDDVRMIGRMAHDFYENWPEDDRPAVDPQTIVTGDLVRGMIANHQQLDLTRLTTTLGDLGIQPLWYDDVEEIAPFVQSVAT